MPIQRFDTEKHARQIHALIVLSNSLFQHRPGTGHCLLMLLLLLLLLLLLMLTDAINSLYNFGAPCNIPSSFAGSPQSLGGQFMSFQIEVCCVLAYLAFSVWSDVQREVMLATSRKGRGISLEMS